MNFVNIADLQDPNDLQGRSYRQVNYARKHIFEVGQLVELDDGVRLYIAKQSRDCDGTPLYCLTPKKNDYTIEEKGFANHNWLNGIDEESLKLIK
jgi:hypothetical protein